jgi:O-antigen/teichoic acid export membrane protein
MAVGLYTSRAVLATLGADDFGLNAVVTSVITIFYFLNNSMAGATSRFLTFELGKGDKEKLQKTFSAAFTIHIIIAFIILTFGETIGLWYLENKMVIPEGRMTAARWVYQLSLVSAMFTITQVPYNATIIAHERMNVYAYIEILQTCLRLVTALLLTIGDWDKLTLYAVLTLCVSIVITLVYKIYCIKQFEECKYKFHWNKDVIRPMLSFSGWDLSVNMSLSAKNQGVNIILNLFWMSTVNAAYGIAMQIDFLLRNFSNNFLLAARPQIIKYYSENNINEMENLIINVTRLPLLVLFALSFPVMLEINFILEKWLVDVPKYTNIFSVLLLTASLINVLYLNLNIAIHAYGKIKKISIIKSIIFISIPILTYLFFKLGSNYVWISFVFTIIQCILELILVLFFVKRYILGYSISQFVNKVVLVSTAIITINSILPTCIHLILQEGWLRLFGVVLSSTITMLFLIYYIALTKDTRERILNVVRDKIFKI